MNCSSCKDFLEDFLDERLDGDVLRDFRTHTEQCAPCRWLVEEAAFARTVARVAFPTEELNVSPHFFSEVWRVIDAERSEPFSWGAVRELALRFTVGVALMIALLVGIDVITAPRLNQNQWAIENYIDAPATSDSLGDTLIGDLNANRDQLLQNLLQRDRQQNLTSTPARETPNKPTSNK